MGLEQVLWSNVFRLRFENGWTQSNFAKKSNKTRAWVSKIDKERKVSLNNLELFGSLFGVDPAYKLLVPIEEWDEKQIQKIVKVVPLKCALKSFVKGYVEDYSQNPSSEFLQKIFNVTEKDAKMAVEYYGMDAQEFFRADV